ncbi:tectonin beta-propeller repeat-containing protein 1 isoform X2 [Varanus komodoensis]|uniref:tectonin beta-propeller repeat-containing protein 1 isoform X2 n=1 Tax=Varanus komodoensis TaxID=61221 RepID=UPI001CF7CF23|nr:tectonin beta-propeller repeat-containing protein 1 isoform X2 [Varanus komodoensis]
MSGEILRAWISSSSAPPPLAAQGLRAGAARGAEVAAIGDRAGRPAMTTSSSLLWAVDIFGRVYTLSATGQYWELCKDGELEFKRVSAVKACSWGLACDHQVYVYIHSNDVPIRYQEETYENQRWNPVIGFCEKLLPSDRWQWSDVSGLKHQSLESFALPSPHWEWESDWYVDENFGGDPTEKGGWTYAIDFPATYTKDKKWNSCVRRRRWIRYRRYRSRDMWAKIPSQEDSKKLPDPFNDLSVGGWEISDEPVGRLSVWAVTLQGQVWYREGVCHHNPEGSFWSLVPTPGEAVQISCGPYDLLWATLWEGQAIIREGIDRNNPQGIAWTIVEPPVPENGILHVSVGVNVVWAVTKDRKVWFRRGVNSHNPCGTSWIEMVGEMTMVSVGLNDQVWGISSEDRVVYFRQGVTPSELSGKMWKAIVCSTDSDRSQTGSSASLLSAGHFFTDDIREQASSIFPLDGELPPEGEASLALGDGHVPRRGIHEDGNNHAHPVADPTISPLDEASPARAEGLRDAPEKPVPNQDARPAELQWADIDLKEASRSAAAAASSLAETSSLSSLGTLSVGMEEHFVADGPPLWVWVSGGGCLVESHSSLKWFTAPAALSSSGQSLSLSITPAQTAVWRKQIFQQLSERTRRELENFRHYEQAVEQSVWVKNGTLQWWRNWKPYRWVDVRVALEQFTGNDGVRDSILFIYYTHGEEKKYVHVFLNEVTILVEILNEARHSFALYTAERTKQRWPIQLAAATEQEMHDWLSLLSMSCCESRQIQGPPSPQAIWSLTCKGDIFVSEPSPGLEAAVSPVPCDQMFWRQVGGHLRLIECNSRGIVWGVGYDHAAWVYTGGYGGSFFSGLASSSDNIFAQSDVKCVYIYENQRWNPVTGYSSRGLPTDRYMWSDASGLQERTKANTKPPSPQWSWASDWYIDFSVSGGTDREGWQYAADFPAKCKIVTTGPWLEVPPIPLWDVSIIPCLPATEEEFVALWAISDKGDVLCRLCVTPQNPAGTSWLHVGTNQPFVSVSIGAFHQVWAIARDGSVFYRGSVSPNQPEGDCWYHIPSPPKQKIKQVSVGRTSVFVVDKNGNLWYRQGITPSYPQGTSWEHVSNNVRKVSVGPLDQVWVIADKVQGSHSLSCGTVCHRTGVQPLEPKGISWDYGIGGGWEHITARANAAESFKPGSREASVEPPPEPREAEAKENGPPRPSLFVDLAQGLDKNAVQC